MFKRQTNSPIKLRTHKAAYSSQFSGAMDYTRVRIAGKLTDCHKTHIAEVSIPVGRWMRVEERSRCKHTQTVQGQFKMQAHRFMDIVMDIAAFKVSHSFDQDATALQGSREDEVNLHRGNGTLVRFAKKLTSCHTTQK